MAPLSVSTSRAINNYLFASFTDDVAFNLGMAHPIPHEFDNEEFDLGLQALHSEPVEYTMPCKLSTDTSKSVESTYGHNAKKGYVPESDKRRFSSLSSENLEDGHLSRPLKPAKKRLKQAQPEDTDNFYEAPNSLNALPASLDTNETATPETDETGVEAVSPLRAIVIQVDALIKGHECGTAIFQRFHDIFDALHEGFDSRSMSDRQQYEVTADDPEICDVADTAYGTQAPAGEVEPFPVYNDDGFVPDEYVFEPHHDHLIVGCPHCLVSRY